MKRGARFEYDKTKGRFRAAIDAALARDKDTKSKRSGQHALGKGQQDTPSMVHIAGPLLVRITRHSPGAGLDDDNLSGGCKQCLL